MKTTQTRIIDAAIELFRRHGYVATSLDAICATAGVSKGALFHHFPDKQAVALAGLASWADQFAALDATAPYRDVADPLERLRAAMDWYRGKFSGSAAGPSCLAGTIAQEISATHPPLRDAANACFTRMIVHIAELIRMAAAAAGRDIDADSLARLWAGTFQGSLILEKASQSPGVVGDNLRHIQAYIDSCVSP